MAKKRTVKKRPADDGTSGGSAKWRPTVAPRRESAAAHGVSDSATPEDTLGFAPYVQAMADFLLDKDTQLPLTLSIEGEWGSGKSSFMLQLEEKLRAPNTRIVKFNAWRHDSEEALWAAFAMTFADQLSSQMGWWQWAKSAWKLFWSRVRSIAGFFAVLRAGILSAAWVALVVGILVLWFTDLVSIDDLLSAEKFDQRVREFVLASCGVLGGLLAVFWTIRRVNEVVGNPLKHDLRKYLKLVDYADRIAFVEQFHEDFKKVVQAYADGSRVFVFIDDLDRCEIPKAADLMQAINLMIAPDNPLVFVLGLDREKIAAGLAVKHEKLLEYVKPASRGNNEGPEQKRDQKRDLGIEFGYEFIERFVQIPFQVPAVATDRLDHFLESLAPREKKEEDSRSDTARRLSVFRPITWSWGIIAGVFRRGASSNADAERGPDDGGGDAGPIKEDSHDDRWNNFQLKVGRDSEAVRQIVTMIALAMDNNPRRLIQFLNLFRLRAYVAYRTGLFNPKDSAQTRPLQLEQLGKFVAATLRWPLFLLDLQEDPALLSRLAAFSDATEGQTKEPETDSERRWRECTALIDLLAYKAGIASVEDAADYHRFTMTSLDCRELLRVSPALVPLASRVIEAEPSSNLSLEQKIDTTAKETEATPGPEEEPSKGVLSADTQRKAHSQLPTYIEGKKRGPPILRVEYDPAKHFTRHSNGDIEVRITIRNIGDSRAQRVRVKMESLVPLTNKEEASPRSTQFNALRLQVVREKLGFSLHAGDAAEVILLTAEKGGEFYLIHGYDTEEQPQSFKTRRAEYEITVIANAMEATPDTRTFVVTPQSNGEIRFEKKKE